MRQRPAPRQVDDLGLQPVNPGASCYSVPLHVDARNIMPGIRERGAFVFSGALLGAALAGCASSQVVVVGQIRPPIAADRVQIYLQPPASKYEHIANVSASSRGSLALTSEDKIEKVIERLKIAAAKFGANGILLHGVGSETSGSVGGAISTESSSGHSPYIEVGVSAFTYPKSGDGVAIFVEPEDN